MGAVTQAIPMAVSVTHRLGLIGVLVQAVVAAQVGTSEGLAGLLVTMTKLPAVRNVQACSASLCSPSPFR